MSLLPEMPLLTGVAAFAADPAASITGTVKTTGGTPVAGAVVTLSGGPQLAASTPQPPAARGEFVFGLGRQFLAGPFRRRAGIGARLGHRIRPHEHGAKHGLLGLHVVRNGPGRRHHDGLGSTMRLPAPRVPP